MDGYQIIIECGCQILLPLPGKSGVPTQAILDFGKLCDKEALIDQDLARAWGAIFVAGTVENLKKLAESQTTARARSVLSLGVRVSPEAQQWLETGEFGLSSYAIFHKMTGAVPPRAPRETTNHPHDPSDLRRCLLLLEAVPEFEPRLGEMREVSAVWARLVDSWSELKSKLDEEARASGAESWRARNWSAPETYAMMRKIIDGVPQNIDA